MLNFFIGLLIGFPAGYILCGLLINAGNRYRTIAANKPNKTDGTDKVYAKVEEQPIYPSRIFIGEC